MGTTTQEFGIVDQDGVLFGLPARTFTSYDAARDVMTHLQARRLEMEVEAGRAQANLDSVLLKDKLTVEHRDNLEEVVRRWKLEQPRSYSIVVRDVGRWEAVAPLPAAYTG